MTDMGLRPRPHAPVIKAWADGHDVEYRLPSGNWCPCVNPLFDEHYEYRVRQTAPIIARRRTMIEWELSK